MYSDPPIQSDKWSGQWLNDPSKVRILITDDDRMVRRLLHSTLRGLGHTNVAQAESGVEALAICNNTWPDLVFLDIDMPGNMDGMQVLQELRATEKGVFITMITAHSTANTVEQAIKLGVDSFLVKPFTAQRIRTTLENFHKSKRQQLSLSNR